MPEWSRSTADERVAELREDFEQERATWRAYGVARDRRQALAVKLGVFVGLMLIGPEIVGAFFDLTNMFPVGSKERSFWRRIAMAVLPLIVFVWTRRRIDAWSQGAPFRLVGRVPRPVEQVPDSTGHP